jgi:hypothetical protein
MLAFAVGPIVPTTRKDIGLRSHRILSAVLSSLHTLYIYMRAPQTELIFVPTGVGAGLKGKVAHEDKMRLHGSSAEFRRKIGFVGRGSMRAPCVPHVVAGLRPEQMLGNI